MRSPRKSAAKVVVMGGGTGTFAMLTGLRPYFDNLTAIVTVSDEGRSSGMIREDFGILPPGDIRQALVALSGADNKLLSELFNYRFEEGRLESQSFGNLMITALERITGSFMKAIEEASRILSVKGKVLPVSLDDTHLCVKLENGETICGEHNIDIPKHDGTLKIERAWLKPEATVNPAAKKAILEADLVILAPGDLYTSIIPNILVRGVPEALKKTRGRVLYFLNIMTKFGETNGFKATDFLAAMERYLGKGVIDAVVVNSGRPSPARLRKYEDKRAEPVRNDLVTGFFEADLLRKEGFVRHDPAKTGRFVAHLLAKPTR